MDIYEQLLRDEGIRLKPYQDTVGKWTIGVGRNLSDKGISEEEARVLLEDDVEEVSRGLLKALPWYTDLNEARQGVLENMAFNLGLAGLLAFHNTLTLMEKGDFDGAATAMLASRWATQVKDRAERLADQLRSGEWK